MCYGRCWNRSGVAVEFVDVTQPMTGFLSCDQAFLKLTFKDFQCRKAKKKQSACWNILGIHAIKFFIRFLLRFFPMTDEIKRDHSLQLNPKVVM